MIPPADLDARDPLEILRWAADTFAPRLGFATGFGPEGCVLVDLVARHRLPVDVFTLDTGLLFPETRELWLRLERRYGIAIRAVRPARSVEQQAGDEGPELWTRDPDRCCALRKVDPLRLESAKFDAWISAIRRDQTPDRAAARAVERDLRFGLWKVNPLAGWTAARVREHLELHDVPTNVLHARGYPSIGCAPCTSPVAPGEDPRAGRWRGTGKIECGLHRRPAGADAART